MLRIFLLIAIGITAVTSGISQKVPIGHEKFSETYSAAFERSKEFARVHDSKSTNTMMGGNVKTTTWNWNYDGKFDSHLTFTETSGEANFRFEMINLGENTFCRIGVEDWKKVQGTCNVRVGWMVTQMSRMMESGAESQFFEESLLQFGEKTTRYTEVGKLEKRKASTGIEIPPMTYESVFTTDAKGRLTKQEYTRYPTGSKSGTPSWVDLISYGNKGTKIEAPIK